MGYTKTTTTTTRTTAGGRGGQAAIEISCECNFGGVTRVLSLVAGVATIVCGIVHVTSQFRKACRGDFTDCVGPWLYWSSDTFTEDVNAGYWRDTLFSLKPDSFCEQWGPLFLGLATVFTHTAALRIDAICLNWARVCMWFLFLALFANFGYAGNLGILTGFLSSLVALLAFIHAVAKNLDKRPVMDVQAGGCFPCCNV